MYPSQNSNHSFLQCYYTIKVTSIGFPPHMNTIGEIRIDKRIVQTQNGVIINAWPQFFKNSGASRYLIPDMSDM